MGVGVSKEEMVYLATQKGNVGGIRELKQQGAGLEWRDPQGRTPLIVSCCHPDGYDAATTLLALGADVRAYRHGPDGGFPIHHAAKRGLNRTLHALLHYGAEPLVLNDAGKTPLGLAREQGFSNTVRMLEDRIKLFSGSMRQQTVTAPGFLDMFASKLGTKKVWVVVLPAGVLDARRPPRYELAVYPSMENALPVLTIPLEACRMTVKRGDTDDPVLELEDTQQRATYKFLGDKESPGGGPAQVQMLYNACKGMPQGGPPVSTLKPGQTTSRPSGSAVAALPSSSTTSLPAGAAGGPPGNSYGGWTTQPPPAGGKPAKGGAGPSGGPSSTGPRPAFASISASKTPEGPPPPTNAAPGGGKGAPGPGGAPGGKSGEGGGDYGGWGSQPAPGGYGGWGAPPSKESSSAGAPKPTAGAPEPSRASGYGGWGGASPAPNPSTTTPTPSAPPTPPAPVPSAPTSSTATPSAPPLPPNIAASFYPTIDNSPILVPSIPTTEATFSKPGEVASLSAAGAPSAPAEGGGGAGGANTRCVICWDNAPEGACVPCGHIACCMECLDSVKKAKGECPVCRAPIREVIKVYQV